MNKAIIEQLFPIEHARIEEARCPFYALPFSEMFFKDAISVKEFEISGLCQSCQDEVFSNPETGDNDYNLEGSAENGQHI